MHSFLLNISNSTVLMANTHCIIICTPFLFIRRHRKERHSVVFVYGDHALPKQKLDLPFKSRMCIENCVCVRAFSIILVLFDSAHATILRSCRDKIERKNAIAIRDMMSCCSDNKFMNINANFTQNLLKIGN